MYLNQFHRSHVAAHQLARIFLKHQEVDLDQAARETLEGIPRIEHEQYRLALKLLLLTGQLDGLLLLGSQH